MKKLFFVLLIALFATPAVAQTLAEKKAKAEWDKKVSESDSVPYYKEKCGTDVKMTLADNLMVPFTAKNADPVSYCEAVLDSMAYMCEDATSKEAIASKIKNVNCEYKEGDSEGTFKLDGDTLNLSFDVGTPNIGDKTKAFLEKNL